MIIQIEKSGQCIDHMLPNLCYGCGTCSGICPNDAIVMKLDKKGTYYPNIDKSKCNGCGTCSRVCPWQFFDKEELDDFIFGSQLHVHTHIALGTYLGIYLGHSTNLKLRKKSSSGGLITALSNFALEEGIVDGVLVTKMDKKYPLFPKPFIAESKKEITSALGSKYTPVPANITLKEILGKKRKYATVGLPCHIQGIRKAEKIIETLNERIVFHFGLICSGTILPYGTDLLLKALDVDKGNISQIHYRGNGWPGGFRVILKNGNQTPAISYSDYFSITRFYLSLPCLVCWDSMNEFSDISFGDAWVDSIKDMDDKGTSLIVSRTERGEQLLKEAESKGIIKLCQISPKEAIKTQQGNINFKKKNLSIRLFLMKIFTGESLIFNNVASLDKFNLDPIGKLRVLLLYTRCLLMSKRMPRLLIEPVLKRLLKFKVK